MAFLISQATLLEQLAAPPVRTVSFGYCPVRALSFLYVSPRSWPMELTHALCISPKAVSELLP